MSPRPPSSYRMLLVGLVTLAMTTATSCFRGPRHSPEHFLCREQCADAHDDCVLRAFDGPTLQACDRTMPACLASCPY